MMTAASSTGSSDTIRVHFLSSGSKGNCTLIQEGNAAYLIDFGLPKKTFLSLLQEAGLALSHGATALNSRKCVAASHVAVAPSKLALRAALLTHTHNDHYFNSTASLLHTCGVTLFLHEEHKRALCGQSKAFEKFQTAGRLKSYRADSVFRLSPFCSVRPVVLPHDSCPTFGFIFEWANHPNLHRPVKMTYLADLGYFDDGLAEIAADSDVLALEFNHDVAMQWRSGRAPSLIQRVLSDEGHLSNEQAAEALNKILRRSTRPPAYVVLLHLSEDCNSESLAHSAAMEVLAKRKVQARVLVTRPKEYCGCVDLCEVSQACALRASKERTGRFSKSTSNAARDLFDFLVNED